MSILLVFYMVLDFLHLSGFYTNYLFYLQYYDDELKNVSKLSAAVLIRLRILILLKVGRVKRICVFEHSVMTNFNCACPAIQRDQGSGFPYEGFSFLTACMSEQRRFWRDCADAQARLNLRCSHRR